ncbi:carboxylesterase 1D-like [Acanthaster planci]|uniref:Carboxylesterase 1D-like n=1 Tax=Acanthaster planci TaxID=133434 RepID=A0A8B7XHL0_ACAPL|nr:carboxylesterase 1D-like [Acanthaster planci]
MNFWAQFARSGNPNAVGSPEWPDFDPENETYIILNVNISTGQRLKADKVAFWNEYIPTITEPFNEKTCSYDVPVRSGTVQKPDTKTVQIESKDGEVLGSIIGALRVADEAMGGREVAEFLGIPYAKPPLGDLRFKPPEDTGPWGDQPLGIPEKLPAACPQDVTQDPWMVRLGLNHTSEDCLTLNIYAPTQNANDTALPVLVFVHTGFGVHGTSSVHDATLLASQIRTIVVVLNYRLGALGFVSTGDEAAPGYYGLHDILTSLKWVNKYIGSFGGDPGRVTVFGHGSGGVLTHLLVLSEKAKGLFNRTVLMATTAISPPVNNQVIPSAPETTKALATKLGCPTTSSEAMINCLREKPAADIVSNTVNPPFGVAFPVVVDGDFITDRPIELLKNGRINDVDVIVGVPLDENGARSLLFTGLGCPSVGELEQYIETVSRLSFLNPGEAASALATEYIGKGGLGDDCETRGSFRKLLNDQLSGWSLLETARLHADAGQSAYVYLFEHKPSVQYRPLLPLYGATADDSLQFLFGDPYSPLVDKFDLSYRLNDKRVTLEHMEFLKNFIYNGNPGTSLSGVEWPSFDSDDLKYMSLTDCPQAYSGVDNDWPHLLRFWAAYLPTITSPVPPPSEVTPCPPDQEPCVVGEGIGLKLSSEQATAVIETLIGAVIGALVLSVFFFGGCMAYRARVDRIERHNLRATREGLPYKLDVGEREESSSPL